MDMMIGKALNSAEGFTALKKSGVAFTDEQEKMIKHLFETGHAAEAQKIILAELGNEFGGQAEAAAKASGGMVQFKARIGEMGESLASKVLPIIDTFAGFLNDHVLPVVEDLATRAIPALTAVWQSIQPALSTVLGLFTQSSDSAGLFGGILGDLAGAATAVWAVLQDQVMPILNNLGTVVFPIVVAAGQVLAGFYTDVLKPALHTVWDLLTNVFLPALGVLAGWLKDILPPLIQGVADFLTGTLFPSFHTVYDFLDQNVIPILSTLVAWLAKEIPPAVQTVADFWNNTLKPALNAVWSFIDQNVIPIITTLVGSVFTDLNKKTGEVASFWTGTLQPALNAVWSFLDKYVIPILGALANVAIALVKKEVEFLAALWEDRLKPALDAVWGFIDKNVIPILKSLSEEWLAGVKQESEGLSKFWTDTLKPALDTIASAIGDTLKPALNGLETILSNVKHWFDGISDAIAAAVSWLNRLADKINHLPSLPDLPGFAGGTDFAPGGAALVGEHGPELLYLPRGSRVIPNMQTGQLLAGARASAGGDTTNHFHFTIDARGATMRPEEFRRIAEDVVTKASRQADARIRSR
jgi:phage-related protein